MIRYDVAVIGSGPAGLEAALNLKIRGKNFLVFGAKNLSSKIELAPNIKNYLGFPEISGTQLRQRFQEHLDQMEIPIEYERINSILPMDGYYMLAGTQNTYEATCVLLATGVLAGKMFPGEEAFLGRGVSYCATCDAPLYRGKVVTIVGYNEEAVLDANYLTELAAKVYYIPVGVQHTALNPAVTVINDSIVEIVGQQRVSHIVLRKSKLETDGVFVMRDSISPAHLLSGLAIKDGFVAVDSNMQTNLPGCFAAGDCTGKPHQYMRAAGQGQTAALGAVAYIDKRKAENERKLEK